MSTPETTPPTNPDSLPISSAREATRVAWPLLRRRPGALVATLVSLVLVGATGLVGPFMLGRVVDVVDAEDYQHFSSTGG